MKVVHLKTERPVATWFVPVQSADNSGPCNPGASQASKNTIDMAQFKLFGGAHG